MSSIGPEGASEKPINISLTRMGVDDGELVVRVSPIGAKLAETTEGLEILGKIAVAQHTAAVPAREIVKRLNRLEAMHPGHLTPAERAAVMGAFDAALTEGEMRLREKYGDKSEESNK